MNIQFGTGVLYGLPNAGNLAANPTPYKFGILQDAAVDFKGDLKQLFGQSQFSVAKARAKIAVSCKAKIATLDPNMLNQLYFGQAQATGQTLMAVDEPAAVPATTTFTITVSKAATFVTDFGVTYAATGTSLQKLGTGVPAIGQYTVNAGTGVYTFAAADANAAVYVSYTYTAVNGTTITLTNQLMGYAPEFRAFLFNSFRSKNFGIELFSCTLGQLSIPTKQEDFWMSDLTFDASCDSSNVLGKIYADIT